MSSDGDYHSLMTNPVHLWYSCPWGKELFILCLTTHHHIGTYLELSGRTEDRWCECGDWDTGDTGESEPGARVMRELRENRSRLRDGGWGGGTGRCRVTVGCCLTWPLTTSVGARHRSCEHPRDREHVTRDRPGVRDKWDDIKITV